MAKCSSSHQREVKAYPNPRLKSLLNKYAKLKGITEGKATIIALEHFFADELNKKSV